MSILTSSYPAAVGTVFTTNFSSPHPAVVGILFIFDNQPLKSCNFRIMVLLNYEYGRRCLISLLLFYTERKLSCTYFSLLK